MDYSRVVKPSWSGLNLLRVECINIKCCGECEKMEKIQYMFEEMKLDMLGLNETKRGKGWIWVNKRIEIGYRGRVSRRRRWQCY